jgi:hypothetical protein
MYLPGRELSVSLSLVQQIHEMFDHINLSDYQHILICICQLTFYNAWNFHKILVFQLTSECHVQGKESWIPNSQFRFYEKDFTIQKKKMHLIDPYEIFLKVSV